MPCLLTIGVKHNAIITVDGAGLPHTAIVSALIYSRKKFVLDAKGKYVGLKLAAVERLFVRYANH